MRLLLLALLLSGCASWPHDPVQHLDPEGFSVPVMTLFSMGF